MNFRQFAVIRYLRRAVVPMSFVDLRVGQRQLRTGLALMCVFSAVALFGQTTPQPRNTIDGQAYSTGPNGDRYVIQGAQVTLTEVPGSLAPGARPIRMETPADEAGKFIFSELPSGCFRVTATSPGLTGDGDEVCLRAPGVTVNANVEMRPEELRESVDVFATTDRIQTTETTAQGTIESSTLRDAPAINERFEDVMPLLPGVVRGPDGLINVKGARNSQAGALVNSANVTDPVTGSSAINLPVDVVSNVTVLSNPYDAQYGKFAGAVSAVSTQVSDSGRFHFQLQNFMPRARKRDGDIVGIESTTPRLTLSGPVVPGRVALTQSFEYRYVRTEIKQAGLPQLQRDTQLESFDSFTQADLHLSERHTATASLSFYPQKQNYYGLNTFVPQPATPNLRQRGYMLGLQDTYVLNSGALISSRVSFKTFDADVKANSTGIFTQAIETTEGGFFNLQNRNSSRIEWAEQYHFAPLGGHGQHLLSVGLNYSRNSYDGRQTFNGVDILGTGNRLVELIAFGNPALLDVTQNEYTAFVQDKWTVHPRLTLDLGLRFDRDSIASDNHPALRLGFAYLLTNDNKTVLRGGIGLFYDKVNLGIPTFLDLPARTETRFSSAGVPLISRFYQHRIDAQGNDLRDPRSLGWSAQLDREVARNLYVRVGVQQRVTTRNFLLDPETTPKADFLTLSNGGWDRYREFEFTTRYQLTARSLVTASYVHSSSVGDLNDFNSSFGNVGQSAIRRNERSRLAFDAPNRFLFWGDVAGPYKTTISPVVDVHTGFPFSVVDEERDFVGPRNRAGRFPRFASVDLQVLKEIGLPFHDGKYKAHAGVRVFNLFNSFNPVDIQNNLASLRFGAFSNSPGREVRGKFVIDF
jgi:TonB dependent receptor-like, beta-barrel